MADAYETLVERTIEEIQENLDKLDRGELNCLPYPFPRSRKDFPGIERGCYYAITANTKVGKSQFTSYVFIFKPLMELYYGKANFDLNIIYFPLEETPERIMQRFMSWVLYEESGGKVRVSPTQLRSTLDKCPKEAIELLQDDNVKDILKFFEEHVIFPNESPNPTGIYNWCRKFAEERGHTYEKEYVTVDEFGEKHVNKTFDYYVPDNKNAFNIIVLDSINLIDCERGMSLRESMNKMSEYFCKYLRNRYYFSPVVIQQQSFSNDSLDAAKLKKFKPSLGALGDSKYISRDCDVVIGLYCPHNFDVESYGGYDITKLRRHAMFAECLVNRNGASGGITSLMFDGAVTQFWELPKAKDTGNMQSVYNYCEQLMLPHTSDELAALNPFIKKQQQQQPVKENNVISFLNLIFHR